ncbi:MAG TPA: DUF5946 family protein [Polyangia bacterium]|jgi:hypothetical protein
MRCPACGAGLRAGDAAGCLGLFHELSVATLSDRDATFPHQLAVDAYAAQHAGSAPKPLTTAFALIGLYLVCERGFTGREAQRAHMFLGRRRQEWPRFRPPADVGPITVADVLAAGEGGRQAALRRWAAAAWAAWRDQHQTVVELVRERFDSRGGHRGV